MSGDPGVTILGERTCGSSGNPRIVKLPLDMDMREGELQPVNRFAGARM